MGVYSFTCVCVCEYVQVEFFFQNDKKKESVCVCEYVQVEFFFQNDKKKKSTFWFWMKNYI